MIIETGQNSLLWTKDRCVLDLTIHGKHHYRDMDSYPGCRPQVEEQMLDRLSVLPLLSNIDWYTTQFESKDRWAGDVLEPVYEHSPHSGACILYGKREPIHPSSLLCTMANLCGYSMAGAIKQRLYRFCNTENQKAQALQVEYQSLWHKQEEVPSLNQCHSVFADDFRISVLGIDPDWWPYSFTHPLKVKPLQKWWKKAVKACLETLK